MQILETERLLLRRLVMEDLPDLVRLYSDPDIRRYFPEGVLTPEETREELEWFLNGHPRHPELGLWATIFKPENKFIGRCGLLPWEIDGQHEVEIAYLIDPAYQQRGLASEAARGILQYAFEALQLSRLICLIDEENIASIKTAEKIGMTFEKESRDETGPFHVYSIEKGKTA